MTAPVADVASLPTVTGQCSATVPAAPTATDNCVGSVTGTTSDALSYTAQGAFTVTWTYDDGNRSEERHVETEIVQHDTPPAPNGAKLPTVTGEWPARAS